MPTSDRHTGVIRQVGALMDSPAWAYLTEDDQADCVKLVTLVCRHPEGGAALAIHWRLYLAALKGRIKLRKYERRATAETT